MIKTSQSFANEESFNCYVKYLAMKKHFTTDQYDYHKYRGKIRASFDTYRTRNDVFFFHKLAQKDDPEKLLMANMIVKPNIWIREILEQAGEDRYIDWLKKRDSPTLGFANLMFRRPQRQFGRGYKMATSCFQKQKQIM